MKPKIKIAIKKWLGSLGWSYCQYCGSNLWFDEEKFDAGYNVHSICLKCNNLGRFDMSAWGKPTNL